MDGLEIISGAPHLPGDLYEKCNDYLVELKKQYFKVDQFLTARRTISAISPSARHKSCQRVHACVGPITKIAGKYCWRQQVCSSGNRSVDFPARAREVKYHSYMPDLVRIITLPFCLLNEFPFIKLLAFIDPLIKRRLDMWMPQKGFRFNKKTRL